MSRPTRRSCRTSASASPSAPASGIARAGGTGGHYERRPVPRFATGNAACRATTGDRTRATRSTSGRSATGVIDALFDAAIEATEEAIVNALVAATTMIGRDGITAHALPHDRLLEVMARGRTDSEPAATDRGSGAAARVQATATGAGFSIGTPIRLPYSVQLPS